MVMQLYQVYSIINNEIETLERNVNDFTSLLSCEKEVLLFPIFPCHSKHRSFCIKTGNCTEAYLHMRIYIL